MLKWYYENELKAEYGKEHLSRLTNYFVRNFIHSVNIAIDSDDLDIVLVRIRFV